MQIPEDDTVTLRTVDAVDVDLQIAGIGSRSYAFIIDWHIRATAALLYLLMMGAVVTQQDEGGATLFVLLVGLPTALIYFGYHPLLEVVQGGRTPGKRMAGVRVVARDGSPAGAGALLVRNLFRLVDSLPALYALGLVTMVATRRQLRLGDLAAGTIVVREESAVRLSADLLTASELAPQDVLLVTELLQRWSDLDPLVRPRLAQQMLQRAGVADPPRGELDLIAALRRLLRPAAAAGAAGTAPAAAPPPAPALPDSPSGPAP